MALPSLPTLNPTHKAILGHVLGALVNALVLAYVKDTNAQVAALGLWASIASALHIPRPQDSTPKQAAASVRTAVVLARNTSMPGAEIAEEIAK